MATQTKTNVRESVQDILMVSSFGFWAMMLGFVPVATIHFFAS
jgi:Na+-transporting NADH:ubiquinone oxidoreductase subunit NqrC